MVTFGWWGNVVSAKKAFVHWSGLTNCPERMMGSAWLGEAGSGRNMFVQIEGQDVVPLGCEALSL